MSQDCFVRAEKNNPSVLGDVFNVHIQTLQQVGNLLRLKGTFPNLAGGIFVVHSVYRAAPGPSARLPIALSESYVITGGFELFGIKGVDYDSPPLHMF